MTDSSYSQTLREKIDVGVTTTAALVKQVNTPPGDASSWGQDIDFAERSLRLLDLIEASVGLAQRGSYRASLVLARAHMEHEMLDCLMLLGTKRQLVIHSATEDEESSLRKREDVADIERIGNNERDLQFRWTMPAVASVDMPDEPISIYYFALQDFQPGYIPDKAAGRVLPAGLLSMDERSTHVQRQRAAYGALFRPRSIVANLMANDQVTDFEEAQIAVHYAFLSSFAHGLDIKGHFESSPWRPTFGTDRQALLEELALLYAAKTIALAINAWLTYIDQRNRLEWVDTAAALSTADTLERLTAHLWYRGGEPCQFDFDEYKRWIAWGKDAQPDALKKDPIHGIPYYSAPLDRLKTVVAMGRN